MNLWTYELTPFGLHPHWPLSNVQVPTTTEDILAFSGVARICCEGQSWNLGHGALTADFRAGCSSCSMTNSFVSNAVLIERAVSCWHLHQLILQITQYLDSWLSNLLQCKLKMKLLEVEGHVPQWPIAGDATACFEDHWTQLGCLHICDAFTIMVHSMWGAPVSVLALASWQSILFNMNNGADVTILMKPVRPVIRYCDWLSHFWTILYRQGHKYPGCSPDILAWLLLLKR